MRGFLRQRSLEAERQGKMATRVSPSTNHALVLTLKAEGQVTASLIAPAPQLLLPLPKLVSTLSVFF
jgi:hypothetical protein